MSFIFNFTAVTYSAKSFVNFFSDKPTSLYFEWQDTAYKWGKDRSFVSFQVKCKVSFNTTYRRFYMSHLLSP